MAEPLTRRGRRAPAETDVLGATWAALKVFIAELGLPTIGKAVQGAVDVLNAPENKAVFEHALRCAGHVYYGAGGVPIAELRASAGYRTAMGGLSFIGQHKLAYALDRMLELLEGKQ